MNDTADNDPRLYAIPDIHGHAKGEHKAFTDERPIPLSARMLFLWFYHACRRGWPRFLMVTDHMNYLTFEDPAAINLVRRALKLAQAGDLYGAAETASVEVGHAAVVSEGLRRGMRYSIGAEVDNDPRSRPDAQNIVDAMKPDGMVRSVHFLTIDHPTHGPNWIWPFDNPEFRDVFDVVGTAKTWELYMATLLDAVERLPGHIVGHFYVPALFGHWPDDATLEEYEDALVDACEARGIAIEFNTRFLYRAHSYEEQEKYLVAHRRLLVKCKLKNVGIAVGSDAHSPKDQGRAFQTVLKVLDECGINELVFPLAGRLARVALRIERKGEALAAAAPATPGADDRKIVRKARGGDVPASTDLSVAPLEPSLPLEVKSKARTKRTRAKSAPEIEAPAASEAGEIAGAAPADYASDTLAVARQAGIEISPPRDQDVIGDEPPTQTAADDQLGDPHAGNAAAAKPDDDTLAIVPSDANDLERPARMDAGPEPSVATPSDDVPTPADRTLGAGSIAAEVDAATGTPDDAAAVQDDGALQGSQAAHVPAELEERAELEAVRPSDEPSEPPEADDVIAVEDVSTANAVPTVEDVLADDGAEEGIAPVLGTAAPNESSLAHRMTSGDLPGADGVPAEPQTLVADIPSAVDSAPAASQSGVSATLSPTHDAVASTGATHESTVSSRVRRVATEVKATKSKTAAATAASRKTAKPTGKPAAKALVKKTAGKKASAKKAPVKKAATKKAAPAPKKSAVKKPLSRAAAKKPAAKKSAVKSAKKPARRR